MKRRVKGERGMEIGGRGISSGFVVLEGLDDASNHLVGDAGLGALSIVEGDLELGE